MLPHPTLNKFDALGLEGMAQALREQLEAQSQYRDLSFEERIGLLIDRELTLRDTKVQVARRLLRLRAPTQSCKASPRRFTRGP